MKLMKIARLIKLIIPPVLLGLLYRRQGPRRDKGGKGDRGNLWEGVYPHQRDVPVSGKRFDGETWIGKTRAYTEQVLESSKNYGTIPKDVTGEHMLLPLVASLACEGSQRKLSILDFGGGMGVSYVHLISSLVNCPSIDYHIIEREGVCEGGARLFDGDERIRFSSEIPADVSGLDIVYISSALQYVEDYAALLARLSAFGARYFLFVKLSAGDFPTYATAQQNVPGTTLPYWFVNVGEIIEIMKSGGYSLIYKSALEQEYDQSNFPEEYRMGRTCNLLFSRN